MYTKNLMANLVFGFLTTAVMASHPKVEIDEFDINTVVFVEEELNLELGFDTADWLPENFDPYKSYIDLNNIDFIEEEFVHKKKLARRLPKNFDPYALPTHALSFNYIDENDEIKIDFDPAQYLPVGFDPYLK